VIDIEKLCAIFLIENKESKKIKLMKCIKLFFFDFDCTDVFQKKSSDSKRVGAASKELGHPFLLSSRLSG
jgi:uncharacterized membrane protein